RLTPWLGYFAKAYRAPWRSCGRKASGGGERLIATGPPPLGPSRPSALLHPGTSIHAEAGSSGGAAEDGRLLALAQQRLVDCRHVLLVRRGFQVQHRKLPAQMIVMGAHAIFQIREIKAGEGLGHHRLVRPDGKLDVL